jgi:hypothetical protein
VPIAAIIWTVASFWWLHWRSGKIIASSPRSFSVAKQPEKLIIEIPLSFFNTGAAPIIIDNLMLKVRHQKRVLLFRCDFTRDELNKDSHHWATQIALNGRQAIFNVFSFYLKTNASTISSFSLGEYACSLLIKINGKHKYKELPSFILNMPDATAGLLPYDNYDSEYFQMSKQFDNEK